MHGTSMNFTARFARRLKARNKAKICKISVLEQNANENSDYIDKIKYLPLQGYSTLADSNVLGRHGNEGHFPGES